MLSFSKSAKEFGHLLLLNYSWDWKFSLHVRELSLKSPGSVKVPSDPLFSQLFTYFLCSGVFFQFEMADVE